MKYFINIFPYSCHIVENPQCLQTNLRCFKEDDYKFISDIYYKYQIRIYDSVKF